MQNRPQTDTIYSLLPSSPVLVWREGNTNQSGYQDRLYTLLTINGETCTIKLLSGPKTFHSIVVKSYLLDPQDPVKLQEPVKLAKPVPLLAKPQLSLKAEPQLLLK